MTTTLPFSDDSLTASLADLRTSAPASVGYGALVEAGLGDRYATIETALGPVSVAWNGRGVSWVAPAGNRDDFELRFSFKMVGGNSGVQYRSKVIDPKEFIVGGYQADITWLKLTRFGVPAVRIAYYSSSLADYYFGVEANEATVGRPADDRQTTVR